MRVCTPLILAAGAINGGARRRMVRPGKLDLRRDVPVRRVAAAERSRHCAGAECQRGVGGALGYVDPGRRLAVVAREGVQLCPHSRAFCRVLVTMTRADVIIRLGITTCAERMRPL